MANRIKGISVEISGDTTRLTKALKNVDSSITESTSGCQQAPKIRPRQYGIVIAKA